LPEIKSFRARLQSSERPEWGTLLAGYPQTDETVSLDAPVWNDWASSVAPYRVVWGKDGRIKAILADPVTRSRMVYGKSE